MNKAKKFLLIAVLLFNLLVWGYLFYKWALVSDVFSNSIREIQGASMQIDNSQPFAQFKSPLNHQLSILYFSLGEEDRYGRGRYAEFLISYRPPPLGGNILDLPPDTILNIVITQAYPNYMIDSQTYQKQVYQTFGEKYAQWTLVDTMTGTSKVVELSDKQKQAVDAWDSSHQMKVLLYETGWYPFDKYMMKIDAYLTQTNEQGEYKYWDIPLDVSFLAFELPGYEIKELKSDKDDGRFILLERPLGKRYLFSVIVFLVIFFIAIIFFIDSLSEMLQVATGLLLGMWGMREIIMPSDLSASSASGLEQFFLLCYLTLGVTIFIWIIANSIKTFNDRRLSQTTSNSMNTQVMHATWSARESAAYLGISIRNVYGLVRNGLLTGMKVRGQWQFSSDKVKDLKNKKQAS